MSEQQTKEENWKQGFHISTNGRRTELSELDTEHLKNMIRKYSAEGYDVSALEEERDNRSNA